MITGISRKQESQGKMATTRSKTKGEGMESKGTVAEHDPNAQRKDRKLELLSDLVQQGRKAVKKAKTMRAKANEEEKDPKIQKTDHTCVGIGIKDTGDIQNHQNGDNGTIEQQIKVQGVREDMSSSTPTPYNGMGRGGGIRHEHDKKVKENKVGMKILEQPKKCFWLDQHTSNENICGWPAQALVQILMKIDVFGEFGIEKQDLTKYNPKLLRRFVIEMRNDLRAAKRTISLDTTISKNTGIFSIGTKPWEFHVYDTSELKRIMEHYLEIAGLDENKEKVQHMTGNEVRQILMSMQNQMLDAEIEPHNVYVQFEYFQGDIANNLLRWKLQGDEENESDYADDSIQQDSEHKLESNELQEDQREEDLDNSKETVWEKVTLTKDTHLSIIRQWSGRVNVLLLSEWYEERKVDFDEDFFKNMKSIDLRYQVVMLQAYLEEENESIEIKVRQHEKHTFSKSTQDWEILALDDEDLLVLYKRFCHTQQRKYMPISSDEMYSEIMDKVEKMEKDQATAIMFSVSMSINFLESVSHINVKTYRLNRKEVHLNGLTLKEEILTWCNKILITIFAKVMDKYGFVMKEDVKKIAPKVLRRYLMEVQKYLQYTKDKHIFKSAVPNLGIFHSETLDWEISNLTIKEMRIILQSEGSKTLKWRGCWNKMKMQEAIKVMRSEFKQNEKKSGIRFQTEESNEADYMKFIRKIYAGEAVKIDMNVKGNLLKFNLFTEVCADVEKEVDSNSEDKTKMDTNAHEEDEQPVAHSTKTTNISNDSTSAVIDLDAIQETTQEIAQNGMFSTDDSKLNMLTKAARVTPMKPLAPKGKLSMKKNSKVAVGKASRRKSNRIDKKTSVNYNEQDDMSREDDDNHMDIIVEIRADMEDWEIHNMNDTVARASYQNCMALRNLILTDEEIAAKSRQEIIDNLFLAREQEKEIQACIKDMEEDELREENNVSDLQNEVNEQLGFEAKDDEIWNGGSQLVTQESVKDMQLDSQRGNNVNDVPGKPSAVTTAKSQKADMSKEEKVHNTSHTKEQKENDEKMLSAEGTQMDRDMDDNQNNVENDDRRMIIEPNEKKGDGQENIDNPSQKEQVVQLNDTFYVENEIKNDWKVVGKSKGVKKTDEAHAVPFRGLIGHSAQNLLGMTVNEYTPDKESGNENSPMVVTQEQSMYILRVNLAAHTKETNHVPTFVKKFARVLRHADATLKILPFDLNNKNANDIITNEKDFPDVEEQIKKWAVGVRKTRYHKLEFSLRVEMTVTFRALKNMIFDWCSKNACYVVFNNIESEYIFRAGWIQGLHPFFHNRNTVRTILSKSAPHLRDKISVYSRTVVQKNKDKSKTYCEALAIDGDFKHKDEILKMLCAAQRALKVAYKEAQYFPFRRTSYLTADDQRKAMKSQNLYNDSINMKDVEVAAPLKTYPIAKRKVDYNFIDWVNKFQVSGKLMFSEVEIADNGKVRLIYKSEYEPQVCELIANIYTHVEQAFGKDATIEMLGNEELYASKKDLYSAESMLAYECAQHFRSLPEKQGKETSSRMRKPARSYAQAAKPKKSKTVEKKDGNDIIMQESNSTDDNSTDSNSTDNSLHEQIAELSQVVTQLQEQVAQKNSGETTQSDESMRTMEIKVEENRKELLNKIEEAKQGYQKDLRDTENNLIVMIEQKEEKFTKQIAGMKEFFTENMQESEKRATARADEQKQASDQILQILLGRSQGNHETPKVVEPKASSHCGAVR